MAHDLHHWHCFSGWLKSKGSEGGRDPEDCWQILKTSQVPNHRCVVGFLQFGISIRRNQDLAKLQNLYNHHMLAMQAELDLFRFCPKSDRILLDGSVIPSIDSKPLCSHKG